LGRVPFSVTRPFPFLIFGGLPIDSTVVAKILKGLNHSLHSHFANNADIFTCSVRWWAWIGLRKRKYYDKLWSIDY